MTINAHFRGEFDGNAEPIFHCPACNLGMVGGYPVVVDHVERVHPDHAEQQMNPALVMLAIENGLCDTYLMQIIDKARSRKEIVSARTAVNLDAGDRFVIVNISPKLLTGQEVELIEHKDATTLKCRLLTHTRRANYPVGMTLLLRHSHVGTVTYKINP